MAEGNGRERLWSFDLKTIIIAISTIGAFGGQYYVNSERIAELRKSVDKLEARSDARAEAIANFKSIAADTFADIKSDVRNLETRIDWLEKRQTRSFVPPPEK